MGSGVWKFTIADTINWDQVEGKQISGGDVIDESSGYRMSAMYWRFGKGEQAAIAHPADEVWIISSGAVTIRTGRDVVTARAGEVLLVPNRSPGTAEAEADTELLTVAHPPSWKLDQEAWESVQDGPPEGARVGRLAMGDVQRWEAVGDEQVLISEPPGRIDGAEIGVQLGRFSDAGALALADRSILDDQLLVVSTGALAVRTADTELMIRAGEFAYLPAGHQAIAQAATESEAVVVRHPGSRVNR